MTETGSRRSVRPNPPMHDGRSSVQPPSGSVFPKSEPPSGALASEDFLYHLHRGSEFLQDSQVDKAKEELESALRLQPRDVEGQGLLGIVYFRLGLYPRAIDIYEKISSILPHEIAPKVNLALCYLKTGQISQSRHVLEEVLAREPEHRRAWAYLGLILQKQADYGRAKSAFEKAGQVAMADRMRRLEEQAQSSADLLHENRPLELRNAAEGAFHELEFGETPFLAAESAEAGADPSGSGRWKSIELGEEQLPQPARLPSSALAAAPENELTSEYVDAHRARSAVLPMPLASYLREHRLSRPLTRQAALIDEGTVQLSLFRPFAIRANGIRAAILTRDTWGESRLGRCIRAHEIDETLGGAEDPMVSVLVEGEMIARAPNQKLSLLELHDESLTVKEAHVFGFDQQLRYECTRVDLDGSEPLPMLEISGKGLVVMRWATLPRTLAVGERCNLIRGEALAGWTGRIVASPIDAADAPGKLRGFVSLTGEGQILVV